MRNSIVHKEFDIARKFGVELELGDEIKKRTVYQAITKFSHHKAYTSRYALSTNNEYWHIKDDSTCGRYGRLGPKGVEVASFIASGINDLEHVAGTASHLTTIGCKVNDNCGLHIHVDASDLQIDQISTIVAYWIKSEFVLSMLLPLRRYQNEYCKFIFSPFLEIMNKNGPLCRKEKYNSMDFWTIIEPKNVGYFENPEKRHNLNLVNYKRAIQFNSNIRKTLELRWPEGSLTSDDIVNWAVLFMSFIETCKNKDMPHNLKLSCLNEVLTFLGIGHGKNNFLILGKYLHGLKYWLCDRIIKNQADSSHFYSHYSTIGQQQLTIKNCQKIIEEMSIE